MLSQSSYIPNLSSRPKKLPKRRKGPARSLRPNLTLRPLMQPVSEHSMFTDYNFSITSSTTVSTINILDSLLGASAILQAFPAHSSPEFQNGFTRLRQKLRIDRIEFRIVVIGAVGNALVAADLYNTQRIAMYQSGKAYSDTNLSYLVSTYQGGVLNDVECIYFDRVFCLPSQAYDSTITTATPDVRNWEVFWEPRLILNCFSTTASGSGAAWDTEAFDILFEHVSDSSLSPHPTIEGNVRLFYSFLSDSI